MKTYRQAQQRYDAMEHPDYWNDREEELERIAEEAEERDFEERLEYINRTVRNINRLTAEIRRAS